MYKHYINVNANGIVTKAFTDAFELPIMSSVLIGESNDRSYDLSVEQDGLPTYKWDYESKKLKKLNRKEAQNAIIDIMKEKYRKMVDLSLPDRLYKGFNYRGVQFQADGMAQQNTTAFLAAIVAGVPVPMPIYWRTSGNIMYAFDTVDMFKEFTMVMLIFVQQCYGEVWAAKDAISTALNIDEVESIYETVRSK